MNPFSGRSLTYYPLYHACLRPSSWAQLFNRQMLQPGRDQHLPFGTRRNCRIGASEPDFPQTLVGDILRLLGERVKESEFDYIVIGAGVAGCVLANRLSMNPANRVLLLEAGRDFPPGEEHAAIRDPFPISLAYPQFSWPDLVAEVGATTAGTPVRRRHFTQGRGVGGGSNIFGMIALRGAPQDYDGWRDRGAAGWGWTDVLPHFMRLENDLDFSGPLHGQKGPIPVRRILPAQWAPFSQAFAAAVQTLGHRQIDDLNADFSSGVGPLPMSNLPDQRISTSMAHLDQATRNRENLTILANMHVDRIVTDGRRATGVVARGPDQSHLFRARETLLCAGGIYSPTILMRSGIGPAHHLRNLGIEVVCDLPAVGSHLMNHPQIQLASHLPRHAVQPAAQRGLTQNCLRFSSGLEGCPENDLLLVCLNKSGWHPLGRRVGALVVTLRRPFSEGTVRLQSGDPGVPPSVKFNTLADNRDVERMVMGVKLCLALLADPRMRRCRNEVFLPNGRIARSLTRRTAWNWLRAAAGRLLFDMAPLRRLLLGSSTLAPESLAQDSQALHALVLEQIQLSHHVSCTCRMGNPSRADAVTDPQCRVVGMQGLRVIDASVMPTLVGANPYFPVLMIAEKMAAQIASYGKGACGLASFHELPIARSAADTAAMTARHSRP